MDEEISLECAWDVSADRLSLGHFTKKNTSMIRGTRM